MAAAPRKVTAVAGMRFTRPPRASMLRVRALHHRARAHKKKAFEQGVVKRVEQRPRQAEGGEAVQLVDVEDDIKSKPNTMMPMFSMLW